jgi:hypothetical protein
VSLFEAPFPSYLAQQSDIDAAWEQAEQRFATLEPPLGDLATRFLQEVASSTGTHRTYFSNPLAPPLLYMPIWLFDSLVAKQLLPADARSKLVQILAGTIQGYLYIRTQDDVLDEPARADHDLLLFGNACCSGMIRAYATALGDRADAFWPMYDRAMVDFSRLTLAERHAVMRDDPYEIKQFEEHADKVSFARIPMLAVVALASRLDLQPLITTLVHQLGIAYGLTNDVVGWPRDLRAGQRTYLLAAAGLHREEVQQIQGLPDEATRGVAQEALAERLREKLYEGRVIRDALARALAMHDRARETAKALELHGFEAFHADRSAWLEKLDNQIAARTLTRVLQRARTQS